MTGSGSPQRVVFYLRCSTADQALDGLSIDSQRGRLQSWAEMTGAMVVVEYVDAGVSGSRPLLQRPGGAKVVQLLEARKPTVDAVVVMRLDRLGRDASEVLTLFRRFRTGRVGLVSVVDQIDLASPHGRVMAGVSAVFCELERSLVSARTSEALAELRRQSRAWNHPPFGWDVQDGLLRRNEAEQKVVRLIRRRRAQGASYRTIAELPRSTRCTHEAGRHLGSCDRPQSATSTTKF